MADRDTVRCSQTLDNNQKQRLLKEGIIIFKFDAELVGTDADSIPVFCEVRPPHVAGQKARIQISVPVEHLRQTPPSSPCHLTGKCGAFTISMEGIHWRSFPTSLHYNLGLAEVELFHIERLLIKSPATASGRNIRFHLAPISYLRSKAAGIRFTNSSRSEQLFVLNLPGIGLASFEIEWVTEYHRDSEVPGAIISAGFVAAVDLTAAVTSDVSEAVAKFKQSLEVLSLLFRQAVPLHGWTYHDGETVTTWVDPLEPIVTPSAREHRGDYVARPQNFVDCASALVLAYGSSEKAIHSLVRHLALAINPYRNLRDSDHFLFMFTAFERVIESAWFKAKSSLVPTTSTGSLVQHLQGLIETVNAKGGDDAKVIAERIKGLIGIVKGPTYKNKFQAFHRIYPAMGFYGRDLWPIIGSEKERGLREIRNAIAHGSSSFVSVDVVAVAAWHLSILLERTIFILLNLPIPEGILPNSYLLQAGARGWYERDWWDPLRSAADQPI
jgi:hypothetical protein